MTTEVIDIQFHGTSFPATYTGPGTIIGNPRGNGFEGGDQEVIGYFTSNGNAVNIPLGFVPDEVEIINVTDGLTWKWQYGMPAANSIKTTLGGSFASVIDTGGAITASGSISDGTGGKGAVLLSSTLCGTSKVISYRIS